MPLISDSSPGTTNSNSIGTTNSKQWFTENVPMGQNLVPLSVQIRQISIIGTVVGMSQFVGMVGYDPYPNHQQNDHYISLPPINNRESKSNIAVANQR